MDDEMWNLIAQQSASQASRQAHSPDSESADQDLDPTDTQPSTYSESAINFTPSGTRIIYITKSGAFIKFEFLSADSDEYIRISKKLENYFTIRSKTILGHQMQMLCAKMDKANKRIIIPRFGAFEVLTAKYNLSNCTTVSQLHPGDAPSLKYSWHATQTDNQKLLTHWIMANYYNEQRMQMGSAGVIVNLEAGQGKSYLAAYLIYLIQKKAAIILHTTALMEQWVQVIKRALGENVSIGYYHSKKKKLGDIMLLIINSAASSSIEIGDCVYKPSEFYNQFGIIIFDECHLYSSTTARTALKSAQAPYMLGLSATPDEHPNGYDKAVWWLIGPVLNAADLPGYIASSDDFTGMVHRIMYYGPPEYTKTIINDTTEMTATAPTINMICEDEIRSSIVIQCICDGLDKGLYMFVFADRREYLTHLSSLLKTRMGISGDVVDSDDAFIRIVGGSSAEDMEHAEVTSRVIFTTYQYMGTGKSIVKMCGLVLATPRKTKMKQYINRIFRLGSDTRIKRHIYDICDMRLKLSTQWSSRATHYNSKNYEIVSKKINYTDLQAAPTKAAAEPTPTKAEKPKTEPISAAASKLLARLKK